MSSASSSVASDADVAQMHDVWAQQSDITGFGGWDLDPMVVATPAKPAASDVAWPDFDDTPAVAVGHKKKNRDAKKTKKTAMKTEKTAGKFKNIGPNLYESVPPEVPPPASSDSDSSSDGEEEALPSPTTPQFGVAPAPPENTDTDSNSEGESSEETLQQALDEANKGGEEESQCSSEGEEQENEDEDEEEGNEEVSMETFTTIVMLPPKPLENPPTSGTTATNTTTVSTTTTTTAPTTTVSKPQSTETTVSTSTSTATTTTSSSTATTTTTTAKPSSTATTQTQPESLQREPDAVPVTLKPLESEQSFVPQSAQDVEKILASHLNTPGQVVAAQKNQESMDKLKKALKEFHSYAMTPATSRAPKFANAFFSAKSKSITLPFALRIGVALSALDNMKIGEVTEEDAANLVDDSISLETLTSDISHALWHFIESQESHPKERKALSMALIARVVKNCNQKDTTYPLEILINVVTTWLMTFGNSLLVARYVGPENDNDDAIYADLIDKIVQTIFGLELTVNLKSASAINESINKVSAQFETAAMRFSPINNPDGSKKSSYANELAILLCRLINRNTGSSNSSVQFQSVVLMPKTIMYPVATYDVISGFMDGVLTVFSAEKKADTKIGRTVQIWAKNFHAETLQARRELAEKNKKKPKKSSTAATSSAPNEKVQLTEFPQTQAVKSQVATEQKTTKFLRRFEVELEDE